jgi:hypothetical protein
MGHSTWELRRHHVEILLSLSATERVAYAVRHRRDRSPVTVPRLGVGLPGDRRAGRRRVRAGLDRDSADP